ncbi:MAG: carboxypeptidase-like regulatory domain-containing protein, partial [Anaerolineales bacterium]
MAEYLYKYAHAYGLFDDAPAAPTQTPKPTTKPATCDPVNCGSKPSPVCSVNLNYSLSQPGCEDGKCVYFSRVECENGCDQNTGLCITSISDPNDPKACEGVDCSYLPAYSCSESGDTSYYAPGCSAGRCGYFESITCDYGCDQATGQCSEAPVCTEICPDHCEGDTAFSAMGCEGGECEWIERECPFGCDASLPGMCVQPQGTVVLSASKDGYSPQQMSVENPDTAGSLTISGVVSDQKTGAPVEGAKVSVAEGAQTAETVTDENGYYQLVARGNSADVMSNAEINFSLEPLTVQVEVVLEDVPMYPAGTSIVESTMRVAAAVYDPNGTLLKDRELTFAAVDPNNASWGSFSSVSGSNESGYQVSTLTAGEFPSGSIVGSGKVPVRVLVTDTATGITGEAVFNVIQIDIDVDYYPVLATCADCGPYPVTVTLTHPLGDALSNVSVTAELRGGGGFLTTEMFGTSGSDQLSLQTNANNQVTFYFKPQMSDLTQEYNFSLYIMAEGLGVVEAVPIRAEPLDIAISRLEQVAFSGNTGDYAYFNIGVTDLLHPNAPVDRLGIESHSPVKYQVTIRQTYPEVSPLEAAAYSEQVQLVSDGKGGFRLKDSNSIPPTPHVVPHVDGSTSYNVVVIAVDSISGKPVYDRFTFNNSTPVIIESGSPAGWFHTFLMNGVLTPTNMPQALLKCAFSFIPVVGDVITAIDALNESYQHAYGDSGATENLSLKAADRFANEVDVWVKEADRVAQLGREAAEAAGQTANVEEMSQVAKRLGIGRKSLMVFRYLGNVYGCAKDFYTIYNKPGGTGMVIGSPVCCLGCAPISQDVPLNLDEEDYMEINAMVIPFFQKILRNFPDSYAVQLVASPDSNVVVMTQYGELPEFYAQDGVYFFMLPKGEAYQIEITNSDLADLAVYDRDPQESADVLVHHVENLNP